MVLSVRVPATVAAAAIAWGAAAVPCGAQAPAELESDVRALLELSQIESVAGSLAEFQLAAVHAVAGPLTSQQGLLLDRLVREELALERVREDLVAYLVNAGDAATVHDLLRRLRTGAHADLMEMRETEPGETLEQYALRLQSEPPPESRVMLIAEWAQVQKAADFFLALQEGQRAAAHTIAAALDDSAPAYEPLTQGAVAQQLQQYFGVALVSFLQMFEAAPDDLIARATADYASAAGQWYVDAYSLGLLDTIENAAGRVAARLAP